MIYHTNYHDISKGCRLMTLIYLDHAATTPIHPVVLAAMNEQFATNFGNPSSIHSFGRKAHQKLEETRQLIAKSLQVKVNEIIFNSGGTEGNNTALIEGALAKKAVGKHLITTRVEHPSVLQSMRYLETLGFEVTYLPVDTKGEISVNQVQQALREETILVSIMFGNNETGTLFPIREIGELLRNHPAMFHTDAVQAYGIEEIFPSELGIDLMSVSAHKINGPKGVGFLYKKETLVLPAFMKGGSQESKRRAGTENLAGIVGLATAVECMEDKRHKQQLYTEYQEIITQKLNNAKIVFQINGHPENKLKHIFNLRLNGISSDLLLMNLDLQGVAISTGSACSAGVVKASHVLEAMYGKNHPATKESIRISFGLGIEKKQIEQFCTQLITIVQRISERNTSQI